MVALPPKESNESLARCVIYYAALGLRSQLKIMKSFLLLITILETFPSAPNVHN